MIENFQKSKNKRIVSISIDLKSACKLDYMFNKLPDRSFEVGIAEGNAIGIAVGLSFEKFRPFSRKIRAVFSGIRQVFLKITEVFPFFLLNSKNTRKSEPEDVGHTDRGGA